MINLLILLAGALILGLSLFIGVILPLGRQVPAGRSARAAGAAGARRARPARRGHRSVHPRRRPVLPFVEVPAERQRRDQLRLGPARDAQPGLHIVIPIVHHVAIIDTRVQPHQFQEIDAASSEYQTVR